MTDETTKQARNWPTIIGGIAVIVLVLAVLIVARSGDESAETPAPEGANTGEFTLPTGNTPLQVGDLPYDFTLTDLEGNEYTLSELHGKSVILNFWASWCGPCRIEFPHLQEALNTYGGDDVLFLALNQKEDAETIADYMRELGLTLTPLQDADGAVANSYGIGRTLPTTIFLNPDSEITALHRGPMTFGQIEGYLAETIP